jgi:hypothetical protein
MVMEDLMDAKSISMSLCISLIGDLSCQDCKYSYSSHLSCLEEVEEIQLLV